MTRPQTLLAAWDLRAKKRLGQHFLSDPNISRRIVEKTGLQPHDTVLEIGAGLGALTIPAARAARAVYAVEKDPDMAGLLITELLAQGLENVTILLEDILSLDLGAVAARAGTPLVVQGNLPYNISSQIIVQLIESRRVIRKAVLMLQKELAERLLALPGSKAYGRLSVMLRYCADLESLLIVKAAAFFPRPKVDSEVIAVSFQAAPSFPARDESHLFRVIKAAFGQRRKTLKNALGGSELHIPPAIAGEVLAGAGIDPARRAETLTASEFVRLSNDLYERGL